MPYTPSANAIAAALQFRTNLSDAGPPDGPITAIDALPPKALFDAFDAYMGGGGGGGAGSVLLVPATKVLGFTASPGNHYRCDATLAGFTATLPAAAALAGKVLTIKNTGTANVVTIARTGGDTIDGATSLGLYPGEAAFLVAHSSGWDLI